MLTLELLFQKRDPPVLVVAGSSGAGLECGSGVLEEFLLPTVEHRGVDPVLVTQVRNGGVFEKMEPKNGDLLLSCEAIPDFLGHGKTSTRNCSLSEQTVCHISIEAKQDHDVPRGDPAQNLRDVGVEGRNLMPLVAYLQQHRLLCVRELPREQEFQERKAPAVTRIIVMEVSR